jgi:hypothetical protein
LRLTAQPNTCVTIPPVSERVKLDCGEKVNVQVDASTTEHLGHIFVDLVGPEEKETVTEEVAYSEWSECKQAANADSREQCSRSRTKTVTITKKYVCKEPVIEVKTSQESEPCKCPCVEQWSGSFTVKADTHEYGEYAYRVCTKQMKNYKEIKMNKLLAAILVGMLAFSTVSIAEEKAAPKTKRVCVDQKDPKTGKVKKVNFTNNPIDKGLDSIISPFLGKDILRPVMSAIHFDKNGITATNAHILITLPYPNEKYEGSYDINRIKKEKSSELLLVDETYPTYEKVIPLIIVSKVYALVHWASLNNYHAQRVSMTESFSSPNLYIRGGPK